MVSILQLHYFRHVLRLGALKCCHRFPKRWFKGGLWSVSRCWRIADSALSRVARPSRQSVTVLVNLSRILIASSIINYWWHSSNPPQPTMHLGLVIIEDFEWSIFCDCALCASARQFKGGGMCKCAKKKEFREWPMLDLNLSWQCLQKISLGPICHRLVRFPSSHSLHCYALSRERKSPEKVGDLWKSHTMTDPIWMTGTNSLKRTTFGILWPTEQEDVFDPLSWTSWDFFSLIWSLLRWKQWQYLRWLESNCSMVLQSL